MSESGHANTVGEAVAEAEVEVVHDEVELDKAEDEDFELDESGVRDVELNKAEVVETEDNTKLATNWPPQTPASVLSLPIVECK